MLRSKYTHLVLLVLSVTEEAAIALQDTLLHLKWALSACMASCDEAMLLAPLQDNCRMIVAGPVCA